MAGRVQVEVVMPALADRWRPVMVAKVTGEALVMAHLQRDRVKIQPGFRDDQRVKVFVDSCETQGIEQAIRDWERTWEEFTRWRREWMQRLGHW